MMKRANGKSSTDLLVCFPTRAHLTLMPKPICSPARPSDPQKNKHHLKKLSNRTSGLKSSPALWSRTKQIGSSEISSEPTSPKVTCSGQIKIRPKASSSSKNWQSVMEEIERIHHHRKKPTWVESIGFKKEIIHFLTCLRSVRFDFRCFGSIPEASSDLTSDDDDDDDHDHGNNNNADDGDEDEEDCNENSKTVFSKWFMVLQENNNKNAVQKTEEEITERICVPPPNALLLMRCRSAPAKSWLEENEEIEKEESKKLRELFMEEEKMKKENEMLLMRYDADFYKLSSDIAKETWVVGSGGGGNRNSFSRSLSWKR